MQIAREACLICLAGPGEGALHRLAPGRVAVIGRSEAADVVVPDASVSRVHARLGAQDGRFVLEDAGSRNGTVVDGEHISRRVLAGDEIIVLGGKVVLKFSYVADVEARARERLLSAALRDPLTDVYNRRHFDERLTAECAAARRHGRPLCLLLIDIDDFKQINDRHGHPVGDRVLRGVAHALRDAVRREDALFRYGGEEFAVLTRETGLVGAMRLGDRLRERVGFARLGDEEAEGPRLHVRISVGVAEYDPAAPDQEMVARADAGLYAAKRQGKNRTVAM